MGLHIPAGVTITTEPEYSLSYSKKGEIIAITAPNAEDVKTLFTWLKTQVWP